MSGMQRDTLEVRTAENVGIGYDAAGIGSRFFALTLDYLCIAGIVLFVTLLWRGLAGTGGGTADTLVVGVFIPFFAALVYFVVAETATAGRTAGKRALGLRVIRVDGGAPGLREALIRGILRATFDSLVGIFWMFFHPQSRRLGDIVAGTLVVRERRTEAALPPTAPVLLRTPDAGPAVDGLERLGVKELAVLRSYLSRPGLTPQQRSRVGAEMAHRLLDRMELPAGAPERQWPAELFLERLYLQLASRLGTA